MQFTILEKIVIKSSHVIASIHYHYKYIFVLHITLKIIVYVVGYGKNLKVFQASKFEKLYQVWEEINAARCIWNKTQSKRHR